jgi:transcription termination factor Rho
MPVLERPELQASPLADLHAIADQLGLEGFRRLRKPDLIDAILGEDPSGESVSDDDPSGEADDFAGSPATGRAPARRRTRSRAKAAGSTAERADAPPAEDTDSDHEVSPGESDGAQGRGRAKRARGGRRGSSQATGSDTDSDALATSGGSGGRAAEAVAEGVVELLGNGSAFLRLNPPETSDGDVYISAAQVRRCELVSGDRVSGPVRTPRRSERYPSLIRVDTINGASADAVSDGSRYDDLPVSHPTELLKLGSGADTLARIEKLAPLGRGSRALIVGGPLSGKTETLRSIAGVLAAEEGLDVTLVLLGARPEEVSEWRAGPLAPAVALTFAASAESQGQALEQALDVARRLAARKGDAVVLVDGLDGLHPHAARRALAAARNLSDGGSLTVIATASRPFGGESTVIALSDGRDPKSGAPVIDAAHSATLKPELLVGERGATAILKERAAAAGA